MLPPTVSTMRRVVSISTLSSEGVAEQARHLSAEEDRRGARELASRQIIDAAVVSEEGVDILDAVGMGKPDIGVLDDAFLPEVRNLPRCSTRGFRTC